MGDHISVERLGAGRQRSMKIYMYLCVPAPVLKGQQLGTLRVEAGGRLLREIAVYPYRDMADIALDTADGLLKQVPCYLLGCRPDEEAVQMVKNTLRIGEKK